MNGVGLLFFSLLLMTPGCRHHQPPPTPAGTHFVFSSGDYEGTTSRADVGAGSTVEKHLILHLEGEPPLRFALRIVTGQVDFTYHDGSRARREVPRKVDAEVLDRAPEPVRFTCEPDLNGPTVAKPTALFMACSFSCQGGTGTAVLSVYGDGALADVGPVGGLNRIEIVP